MSIFIAELTHCAATENEQRMSNMVARLNFNDFYRQQVHTAEHRERHAPARARAGEA